MDIITILNLIMVFLVFVIMVLAGAYFLIVYKNKKGVSKKEENKNITTKKDTQSSMANYATKDSIYNFMEFDEIKDGMIIRKNRTQYVMIIQCQGVNYDLMSEEEKVAVEEGFTQFLNTLRFPIQFYVQTRSLNLRDIVEEYKTRISNLEQEIEKINFKIKEATMRGNEELAQKLKFEKRRKENVLEYGADISDYVGRLSTNKNVLQQKTYVIVSYYAAEMGNLENYSKEEVDGMCFSELYTRTQTVMRSLASSEVTGKILDSEELAELLYIAYNRDESEIMNLSKALDAQFDSLYSTSKDILRKKEEALDKAIDNEAVDLATESILIADKKLKEKQKNRKEIVKKKALGLVEEYKTQMGEELYEQTKKEIKQEKEEVVEETENKIASRRGRPKKAV